MSKTISIPDELVEQIKSVAHTEALEQFFIDAARKQVRAVCARQLRQEYDRIHLRLTPPQVYERTLAGLTAFERKYGLTSEQFLQDFETGNIDEAPDDWLTFYRWRTMAYSLQRMEREYGFNREAQLSGSG